MSHCGGHAQCINLSQRAQWGYFSRDLPAKKDHIFYTSIHHCVWRANRLTPQLQAGVSHLSSVYQVSNQDVCVPKKELIVLVWDVLSLYKKIHTLRYWGRIQRKTGVWDPMPELTITTPYVHSPVDFNTFTMVHGKLWSGRKVRL